MKTFMELNKTQVYTVVGHYDSPALIIPPFNVSIDEQHLQPLRDTLSPLVNSDNNGIDIYLAVKLYLNHL